MRREITYQIETPTGIPGAVAWLQAMAQARKIEAGQRKEIVGS